MTQLGGKFTYTSKFYTKPSLIYIYRQEKLSTYWIRFWNNLQRSFDQFLLKFHRFKPEKTKNNRNNISIDKETDASPVSFSAPGPLGISPRETTIVHVYYFRLVSTNSIILPVITFTWFRWLAALQFSLTQ